MRACAPGHVHGSGCGHFHQDKRWTLYQSEPRLVSKPIDDRSRARPESGVYEYDGKVYYLVGHTHGDGACVHKFKLDRWVLED